MVFLVLAILFRFGFRRFRSFRFGGFVSGFSTCHTVEVYTVGFVPSYLLPDSRPVSLDPFLDPLVRDFEDGFIEGYLYLLWFY